MFLSQGSVTSQREENYILKFQSVYIYFSGIFIEKKIHLPLPPAWVQSRQFKENQCKVVSSELCPRVHCGDSP